MHGVRQEKHNIGQHHNAHRIIQRQDMINLIPEQHDADNQHDTRQHFRQKADSLHDFALAHYAELFTENTKGISALKNSIFLAVTSATICAVLGTLLVLAVRGSRSRLRKVVEAIGLLPRRCCFSVR